MNSYELGQAKVAIRYLQLSEKAKWLQEVMARSAATGQSLRDSCLTKLSRACFVWFCTCQI